MNDIGRFTIQLQSPDLTEKPTVIEMAIDYKTWQEFGFAPLPQGHDDPLSFWAANIAREQLDKRDAGIRQLSYTFMNLLRQALEKRDPVDGYYPGELNA